MFLLLISKLFVVYFDITCYTKNRNAKTLKTWQWFVIKSEN